MPHPTPITKYLVPEPQRLALADRLFGLSYAIRLEPLIFRMSEGLTSNYKGGFWAFYTLSNEGFYMAPTAKPRYKVRADNGFAGTVGLDPNMRVHDLRACLAERLLSAGQSLFLVQKLLGHQDPRTTLRYARLSSKALLDASNIASVSLHPTPLKAA